MNSEINYVLLCHKAFDYLIDKNGGPYTQKEIVAFLNDYGHKIVESTFTGFKKKILAAAKGENVMIRGKANKIGSALEKIMFDKLGFVYNIVENNFVKIKERDVQQQAFPVPLPTIKQLPYSMGRWPADKKALYMVDAKKEIINFGLRLKNFTSYFTGLGNDYYQSPVETLLKKGIIIKCYLMNPKSECTKNYFEDRKMIFKSEGDYKKVIETSIIELSKRAKEYNAKEYLGKLQVYTYNHFPSNHFLIIDKDSTNAKMLISPYLYGIPRGKAPQIYISKTKHSQLFNLYLESLEICIKDAQMIVGKEFK